MLELMKMNSKASSPGLAGKWVLGGLFFKEKTAVCMLVLHGSQSIGHQILFKTRYYDRWTDPASAVLVVFVFLHYYAVYMLTMEQMLF